MEVYWSETWGDDDEEPALHSIVMGGIWVYTMRKSIGRPMDLCNFSLHNVPSLSSRCMTRLLDWVGTNVVQNHSIHVDSPILIETEEQLNDLFSDVAEF